MQTKSSAVVNTAFVLELRLNTRLFWYMFSFMKTFLKRFATFVAPLLAAYTISVSSGGITIHPNGEVSHGQETGLAENSRPSSVTESHK
jgi:hypothetical protein